MSDLWSCGAAGLVRMMRAREVSSRDVVTSFLARIDALNPTFNAIVSRRPDDEVLGEADTADRALRSGDEVGPLHGLPHAIKDTANTAGLRSTYGSPLFAEQIPTEDGLAVARVRQEFLAKKDWFFAPWNAGEDAVASRGRSGPTK
jgi:amidase